ncbi:hypothetical protein TCAL_02627 [Tigriopus californicus]|uniref:Major facilitator superfamily (MFS) profile domain-containing protein n=2 Tax=Tigriopus californicus TaxID=6832 RepID=A0A553ND24_TIGCA|nr:hypothetical protein TCAL_02627 [Tigriopus californicus]|eukprot:TCALIF_02627-PA protein Name:"Similar to Orct2 Organic cation transporter-like protein (Drosophila melanogaster)" AED:0.27 eAED:0.27 QI:0/-1/0/1/-1/1/1/0/457
MFQVIGNSCGEESFNPTETVECLDYVYDNTMFETTFVTELDLVCEEADKTKFLGSILMVGVMVGCLIGGPLSDKLGRKLALTFALAVIAPSVIVGGFIPNYYAYATFRFLTVVSVSAMWIAGHAMVLELFGKKVRKFAYTLNSIWYSLSNLLLPGIAYFIRDWRYIHLGSGLISLIALPIIYFCLTESLRWMVLNGKVEEVKVKLRHVGKVNKRALSEEDLDEMDYILETMAARAKTNDERRLGPWNMFAKKFLLQTLILFGIWMTSVLSYYALTLNVEGLAGDMFLNYVISMLVDLPANLIIMASVDKLGRKFLIVVGMASLGISCIAMGFMDKSNSTVIMGLFLVGKVTSTMAMNTVWLYTAELYPTNLRSQAVATCSFVARIAGVTAPFITKLEMIWLPFPMVVLGIPAILFGGLALFLKETAKVHLPETVDSPTLTKDEEMRVNFSESSTTNL